MFYLLFIYLVIKTTSLTVGIGVVGIDCRRRYRRRVGERCQFVVVVRVVVVIVGFRGCWHR